MHLHSLQVSLVVLGLVVRAAAPMPSQQESATGGHQRLVGVFCMLLSSLGYSFLGVSYDLLVRSDGVAPTHNQLVLHVASIGECRQRHRTAGRWCRPGCSLLACVPAAMVRVVATQSAPHR